MPSRAPEDPRTESDSPALVPDEASDLPTVRLPAEAVAAELRSPSDPPTRPAPVPLDQIEFPVPGDRVAHFRVVEEIGRGAYGRVYLARQDTLANRLVALKVTAAPGEEPDKLARLQHPNIVPVYSVHQVGPVQAVCMPYLGRVTLGRAIAGLHGPGGQLPDSGLGLVSSLSAGPGPDPTRDGAGDPTARPAADPAPARDAPAAGWAALARMTHVDACVWVAAQLAAGLAHAHARGLLHRDLKPANVLLTDDGVPMLLDFNAAADAAAPAAGRPGGTVPYMAPEHLRAFLGDPDPVGPRADLYSLGVILCQLLTGRMPHPARKGPTPDDTARAALADRRGPPAAPSGVNPAVPPSVDGLVLKLLAPDPADRYASADDLRDDLDRHLAARPLRHAPNPSARERARKWRRRHPRAVTGLAVAAAVGLVVVAPLAAVAGSNAREAARARDLEKAAAEAGARAAVDDLRAAAVLLTARADGTAPEQGLAAAEAVLDRLGVGADPGWEGRPGVANLSQDLRGQLRDALAEVLVLMTRAETRRPAGLDAAARWNALAAGLFPADGSPAVVDRHRQEIAARRANREPSGPPAGGGDRADVDLLFDGLDLAQAERYADAVGLLGPFCDRRPDHFPGWFARGVCHDGLRQPADAAAAFTVCGALRPDSPWPPLNRGVVRLRQKKWADAAGDFTRALGLKPGWTPALINRGIAREGLKQYPEAAADFTAALADPDAPTRVFLLRARVRKAAGDPAGADADRAEGLRREPRDPVSWVARGVARVGTEPQKAVEDYDAALRLSPAHRDALIQKAIALADHLHRPADAIPVLDRLLELCPDYVEARAGRGVYLARLGRAARARADAADVLRADPSAYRLYQVAGLHAQLGKAGDAGARADALRHLARAFAAGFADFALLTEDADLDPVRADPEFGKLVAAAKAVRAPR